jgi:crotonobetainyl-CoA:carnitine CoA-transferase CaiB-like acyl-CoA transferase
MLPLTGPKVVELRQNVAGLRRRGAGRMSADVVKIERPEGPRLTYCSGRAVGRCLGMIPPKVGQHNGEPLGRRDRS